jgi:GNAT superfamily N-acetyltransferase
MTFTIRPTRECDAPFLPAIEGSAGSRFREAPDLEWVADEPMATEDQHRYWALTGKSWVAVDTADQPFGWLVGERFGEDFHVWEVDVHHDRQGEGAGRALLDAAIDHARSEGLAAVTLTTFLDVTWNEPFYARLGFRKLAAEELGDRLARVLADEVARGFPAERRCAMRLDLNVGSPVCDSATLNRILPLRGKHGRTWVGDS